MNTTPETSPAPVSDAQWRALRNLFHSLAIAVLILTGTFFVFLFRQVMTVKSNTEEMVRFLQQYEQSDVPEMIERIRIKLDDYRKKDPGFTPIYVKYFGTNPPARAMGGGALKVSAGSTNGARTNVAR